MPRIEPTLVPVVADLERGLRQRGVPFGVVGALVPELLLDTRPARMTNDADVMVVVQTFADFETLKDKLAAHGFERTRVPHRLRHTTGGLLDILPYSESIAPDGRLELQDGFVFNMAGFRHVVPHAVPTTIEGGLTLPLAPFSSIVKAVLDRFDDPDAEWVGTAAAERGRIYLEDEHRTHVFELFRWYRLGTGLWR